MAHMPHLHWGTLGLGGSMERGAVESKRRDPSTFPCQNYRGTPAWVSRSADNLQVTTRDNGDYARFSIYSPYTAPPLLTGLNT